MLRVLLFFTLGCLHAMALAQFTDDFSDGNFTQNPSWVGTTQKFVVEDQVLRLNDNQAGEAWLATQSSVLHNTQWEFWVRLAFTPSNNNHPRIYLVSDSPDLQGLLNGYYIRIGKDGTDNKRLYFYRQTGETSTEIMAGATNLATTTNNRIRIKATRDAVGNWEFWADPGGGTLYLPQGSVTDNQHTTTQWFGVHCRYTVSNATNFWFDDFYVGDIIADTTPPQVASLLATSPNTLLVQFSKAVEPATAQNVNNYFVNQGIGAPLSAVRTPENPDRVLLTFSGNFVVGTSYTLTVLNIQDFSGNVMAPFTGNFAWYVPGRFDVVFSEIMANPTPQVGLPALEYLELYNTTPFLINLEGWIFQHGTTQRTLPAASIAPGEYLVLTHPGAIDEMESFGNVVAVPGLSSTALTNAGTTLILYDNNFEIVSWVSYSDQWYGDDNKATGGWSLEKIDLYNFCQGAGNWTASTHPSGGTPGVANSVLGSNPDITPPRLLGVAVENPLQITLYFNESMDEESISNPQLFNINHDVGHPLSVSLSEPDFRIANLILANPLQKDRVYEISIDSQVSDCAGNALAVRVVQFADYTAQRHDIVFNEIMADPTPVVGLPAEKYLEVYNTTDFPIHLRGWALTHSTTRRELPFVFVPARSYAVIATEAGAARLQEFPSVFGVPGLSVNFLTIGGLPLQLENPQGQLITFVHYSDQWYGDPSKASGGWSLEKIDPYNFCAGASNWRAATHERGGTPGTENSVKASNPDQVAPHVLRAGFVSETRVSLFFSETMDDVLLADPGSYVLNQGMGQPVQAIVFSPEFRRVDLVLPQAMQPGQVYEITASNVLTDCAGNALEGNRARVAIPQPADSFDIVINEILFNPPDRGVRYVEIYNRSDKTIDLSNYMLSSKDTLAQVLTGTRNITEESWLLFPGDYAVLTPNPMVVQSQFMTPNPLSFISMTLSSMTNTRGIVVLASKGQRIIDMLVYEENMHYPLLATKKGVALERINYHRPTQSRSNWHSAAQNVGFGTPGYKNSQFTYDPDGVEDVFELYPRVFSPDNDGVDDVLNIAWELDRPGFTANVVVFDSRGRRIRTLARSELLAVRGVMIWDGATDQGMKADMGIYIVHIELFNPEGVVRTYRKTAVLGGRL